MKKILLTGGSGFLGKKIIEVFKDSYEIYAPSHRELDIASKESVTRHFVSERPDYVIHCAGVSDTKKCEVNPTESERINVVGSLYVAGVSAQYGCKTIICSSDQVYCGNRGNAPHREDEVVFPFNQYGKQKLFLEKECLRANPDAVLLRLSWMYDPMNLNDCKKMDFPRILLDRIKNGEPLKYAGKDRRGITDVYEVVTNIEKAFEIPGGVYNFGAPNSLTTLATVENLFKRLGYDPKMIEDDKKAFGGNSRNLTMDISKIEQYGITFRETIDGLVECLEGNLKL